MDDDLIPIATAATLLGVALTTVRQWAITSRIPGAVRGPIRRSSRYGWLVPRAEVERIIREDLERALTIEGSTHGR